MVTVKLFSLMFRGKLDDLALMVWVLLPIGLLFGGDKVSYLEELL